MNLSTRNIIQRRQQRSLANASLYRPAGEAENIPLLAFLHTQGVQIMKLLACDCFPILSPNLQSFKSHITFKIQSISLSFELVRAYASLYLRRSDYGTSYSTNICMQFTKFCLKYKVFRCRVTRGAVHMHPYT